jgi:putative transcriptional regulator
MPKQTKTPLTVREDPVNHPVFQSFTDHFLIAMPGLNNSIFNKSVIYVCDHNESGASGLIINKPTNINLDELFEKVDLPLMRQELKKLPVFHGGPLNMEHGLVLHERMSGVEAQLTPTLKDIDDLSKWPAYASTIFAGDHLEVTISRDVLEALASGAGPKKLLVTLGYCGWASGQLEEEIQENAWLTVPANEHIIFDVPIEERYEQALALLGVSHTTTLCHLTGHA